MKKTVVFVILIIIICTIYQCKYRDQDSILASYIKDNKTEIEMLRNWHIYYEPERDFWSCRHWYNQDSLLAFVFVRVNKQDNAMSYEIGSLCEDSTIAVQSALQNIKTLSDIKRIYGYEFIGAYEIELFNDTLANNYIINLGGERGLYLKKPMKSDNGTYNKHLYGEWYIKVLPN